MIPEKTVGPELKMENLDDEEIKQMINKIRKGKNKIQQEKQTDKIEQENYELEPEKKRHKRRNFKKNTAGQINKFEEIEKLCKIRSDTNTKIKINKAKMTTKEILCEYEETLETMKPRNPQTEE